jgi:beta-lactamase superfamily II metal-dependent hydrolase
MGMLICGPSIHGQTQSPHIVTRGEAQQESGGIVSNPLDPQMQIYFVDVEGGQATLFISPDEHSLLIDTGWPGNNGRDADRIVGLAKQAGLKQIDTVLLTHYHEDHAGGVPQLVDRIPVGTFIDHGPNREMDKGITQQDYDLYQKVLATGKYKHITASAGRKLPIEGFDATVISSDGRLIDKPLPGAGQQNQYCASSPARPADQTENARSVGILIRYGSFKILDLGDLTWDKEMELMCPVNKLGHIDLLIVSHHGWNQSSSPALVNAITPRVAIMDNGAKKGGSTPVLDTLHNAPGLEALWQLHYSEEGGPAHNSAGKYIANLHMAAKDCSDEAHYLRVSVERNGNFAVFNSRTDETVEYAAKK